MGAEVTVCGATDVELEAIRRLFDDWDRVFSRFRPEGELHRINRDPLNVVILSRLFAFAMRAAISAAAATNGLVDPSGGKWQSLSLSGRLLSRPSGTLLDLNGVVKSLAVDCALELISGDGFVSAGGDVAVRGGALVALPAGGEIRMQAGGIATEGSTKRLIDSRTGRPAESRWDEVTAVAGSCLAADVAAKAAFLLSDEGPAWLDERGLAARFREGDVFVENRSWNESLLEQVA
jgi:thiamine biosynthesis lipoprotein